MDELASVIDTVEFRQQLKGYNVDEVDRFLEDLAKRIRKGVPVSPAELDSRTFRKQLKGYSTTDVDAFIADLSKRLSLQ